MQKFCTQVALVKECAVMRVCRVGNANRAAWFRMKQKASGVTITEREIVMTKGHLTGAALTAALLGATAATAQQVELTSESWRNDDLTTWQDQIIPAFEAQHPDIKVTFTPSAPAEYNAVLNSKLEAGSAGDIITCRPFMHPWPFMTQVT